MPRTARSPRHGPGERRLQSPPNPSSATENGKFPPLFDTNLGSAGITRVLTGVQIPRINAIMERKGQSCRRELLDRTLIFNQRHLFHALREFEQFYNGHRPHTTASERRTATPVTPTDHACRRDHSAACPRT